MLSTPACAHGHAGVLGLPSHVICAMLSTALKVLLRCLLEKCVHCWKSFSRFKQICWTLLPSDVWTDSRCVRLKQGIHCLVSEGCDVGFFCNSFPVWEQIVNWEASEWSTPFTSVTHCSPSQVKLPGTEPHHQFPQKGINGSHLKLVRSHQSQDSHSHWDSCISQKQFTVHGSVQILQRLILHGSRFGFNVFKFTDHGSTGLPHGERFRFDSNLNKKPKHSHSCNFRLFWRNDRCVFPSATSSNSFLSCAYLVVESGVRSAPPPLPWAARNTPPDRSVLVVPHRLAWQTIKTWTQSAESLTCLSMFRPGGPEISWGKFRKSLVRESAEGASLC